MIYYGRQSINQDDIDAVVSVLKSPMITQGEMTARFEQAICEYAGAKYAVACSHGTAALHLACLSLGVGEGDIVWTVPNTFVASANCALYCGASIDFVDIDASTFNISIVLLEKKLVDAEKQGRLPKVLIPVHFAGSPCAMDEIGRLAHQYGFRIIEDASHALGASFNDRKIGACEFSDVVTFSFHPVKSITTGEGGMLVANDKSIADKARLLANHGITRNPELMSKENPEPWYYEQIALGYNYRMTDFQAALGLSQVKRLDAFIEQRTAIAEMYRQQLRGLPLTFQQVQLSVKSSWHLFVVLLNTYDPGKKAYLFELARSSGFSLNCHYRPVYLHQHYCSDGFSAGYCPNSEGYFERVLSLPIFSELDSDLVNKLCAVFRSVFD